MKYHCSLSARLMMSAGLFSIAAIAPCSGQVSVADIIKLGNFTQATPDASPVPFQWLFLPDAIFHTGDFTAGTLAFPGPQAPQTLILTSFGGVTDAGGGNVYSFSTKPALDAAFPLGTYTYNLTGGTMGPQAIAINYTQDAYPQSVPRLSPDSFNALTAGGGPDPALPFEIDFNALVPTGGANVSGIQLSISDTDTGKSVFFQSLPGTATSVVVPAYLLTHAAGYKFTLTFVTAIQSGITSQQFVYNTSGTFQGSTGSEFLAFFN